ncbi:MAG: hypothetical protein WC781_00525 [Candidatus Pacearchaeota archaeon]|jgi:hypothetical protein
MNKPIFYIGLVILIIGIFAGVFSITTTQSQFFGLFSTSTTTNPYAVYSIPSMITGIALMVVGWFVGNKK